MLPWALLLCLPLAVPTAAGPAKTLGIAPELLGRYSPSKAGTWQCLNGSKEIPWDFVNDDSCDCPDGSDEPGTGACPDTQFYCRNEGHIGAFIPSSRVNDGLCEPQCCDGSDESSGLCKNNCKEIGDAYQKKRNAELKIQRTGAKVRSTYIAFAHQEKKRLEAEVLTLADEIKVKEKVVERLRDIAERTESISQAALEQKKQSPLYQSLINHHKALKALQSEYKKIAEREASLGDILSTLRTSYNPNYQDMGVLEAVRGWEELAGLPHINDVGKGDDAAKTEEVGEETLVEETPKTEEEQVEEGAWTIERLVGYEMDKLLNTDHVSLLLEHDELLQEPTEGSILFELASYLPDNFLPAYDEFKDTLLTWLSKLGVVRAPSDSSAADSSRARQALQEAENELHRVVNDKETKEKGATKIFDVTGFGKNGEWKKLDGQCFEKDTGDYTYEVCMFNEVKQKPNNGGSTFSLGRFESWNPSPDVKPGEPAYYQKQVYKHGTRCWNGPERNTVLILECGTENVLHTIQELEKCEYQITGTSPALCLPIKGEAGKKKVKPETETDREEL